MALTNATRLRQMLGEAIPANGSELDTAFTEDTIEDLLERAGDDLNQAAFLGWEAKASALSNLVDTSEGSSRRAMGALFKAAERQRDHYGRLCGAGRNVRIGNIIRR